MEIVEIVNIVNFEVFVRLHQTQFCPSAAFTELLAVGLTERFRSSLPVI